MALSLSDPSTRLERSVLLVPASNPGMIAKAAASAADAVCIDLEDAVAPSEKEGSRAHVIDALIHRDFGDSLRMYRINALDTPYAYRDLIEVVEAAGDRLDLVVVPKVERAEDVYVIETLLRQIAMAKGFTNEIGIEVQIETALGCVNANAIAACSSRVEAILYGPGDYAASLQMPMDAIGASDENDALYPGHRWHAIMQTVVVAARAYGKRCIDGPYAPFRDLDGFEKVCAIARVMGFDGKWAIHPSQIETLNRVFSLPEAQVTWARRVLDAYEEAMRAGKGAITVDGKMVDAASLRIACAIIAKSAHATARNG
ncbi:MAG: CoA ester lyase [Thermomicrobia bacterium]|nr:CoA ester lyase [Thermomicrobia bacterium]